MKKEMLKKFLINDHSLLKDAMHMIDENSCGVVFVVDSCGKICGSVTDGDIRRWLLKTGKIDAEIDLFMNKNPQCISEQQKNEADGLMREKGIRALPIIDTQNVIIDILFLSDDMIADKKTQKELQQVPVIIMAGGKGTRLYPYTKVLPKPLIPIGDIPIIERIIDKYHQYGVNNFIMTVNYRKNMIKSYFAELETDYRIEYVEEDKPLGTAGSLTLVERKFTEPIFVANCDVLIQADYVDMYEFHKKSGNAITIVTAMKNDVIPYGVIHTKENGVIEKLIEKPTHSYLVNTGMYIINPDMISLIPNDTFFHMTHLTEKAMEQELKVGMYPVSEDSFLDMGQFEEMKRMEEKLKLR